MCCLIALPYAVLSPRPLPLKSLVLQNLRHRSDSPIASFAARSRHAFSPRNETKALSPGQSLDSFGHHRTPQRWFGHFGQSAAYRHTTTRSACKINRVVAGLSVFAVVIERANAMPQAHVEIISEHGSRMMTSALHVPADPSNRHQELKDND
jgi:hypothetical protein